MQARAGFTLFHSLRTGMGHAGRMHAPLLVRVAALCALAGAAMAQTAPPPPQMQPLPPERSWRLGLAFGYGERTNPLIQSEDIPVLVDVDIAWFGKRWFFDNGDVGFAVLDDPRFTANVVARVNSDRAFFSKTNTKYVSFARKAGGLMAPARDPITGAELVVPVASKPPDRDYAIELGFEMLFDGAWGQASLLGFHDVSDTHEGYEIAADYSYRWTFGRLSFSPSAGLSYKSASRNDYYWGVHAAEASPALPEYHADAGFDWEAGLRTNYYITKSIRLAASANYERLEESIALSPLVNEDHVFGYFAGVAWQF